MSQNPYAVSSMPDVLGFNVASEAETIRKKFLNHEASVKSIGTLYLLGGIFGILGSAMFLFVGIAGFVAPDDPGGDTSEIMLGAVVSLVMGMLFLGISVLQVWTAFGLQKLKPTARIVGAVLSVIGLLGFPIGTLISAYFLYLLLSKKGEYVFSDEYASIREQTPHIRYKTSIIVWIFVALLLGLMVLGIIAAVMSGR